MTCTSQAFSSLGSELLLQEGTKGAKVKNMEYRLNIQYDGYASGLKEHRLSLNEFGPALTHLNKALRITASGIITETLDPYYGSKGGALAKDATHIDLQLEEIFAGSCGCGFAVVDENPNPVNEDLFVPNLLRRSCEKLLINIDLESRGEKSSHLARHYLSLLPESTKQKFQLIDKSTGDIIFECSPKVINMKEDQSVDPLPRLRTFVCQIGGIWFGPYDANPKVSLIFIGGDTPVRITCNASASLIEDAILLRKETVIVQVIFDNTHKKLLSIRKSGEALTPFNEKRRLDYIFTKWKELLPLLDKEGVSYDGGLF